MSAEEDGRELAERVERAFADVRYPGDDRIVEEPASAEALELMGKFRQRHWSLVPLPVIIEERASLPFFTPEAFHFFVPAFLHAALIYPAETDTLTENLFHVLTPPERPEAMERFSARLARFTQPQREVLRRFVLSFADAEEYLPDEKRERAHRYWAQNPPNA
jgi:hypothetical protein